MDITIKWTVDSKSDEEAKKKVKALLNAAYGEMVTPLPDWDPEALRAELHKTKERYLQAEKDLQNRDDEVQELKLENDRLKQRNDIMLSFLNAMCCIETDIPCMKCMFGLAGGCTLKTENYEKEALKIIKKLEALE